MAKRQWALLLAATFGGADAPASWPPRSPPGLPLCYGGFRRRRPPTAVGRWGGGSASRA